MKMNTILYKKINLKTLLKQKIKKKIKKILIITIRKIKNIWNLKSISISKILF